MAEIVTPDDIALQEKLLAHGILFPPEFKDRLKGLILDSMRNVPFKQFQGASLLQVTTSGGRFGDMSYVGKTGGIYLSTTPPTQFTGLADGIYLIMFGALITVGDSDKYMSISINGATPSDNDACIGHTTTMGFSRALQKTLQNNDNNTIEFMYKFNGSDFNSTDNPWATLIRIGSA